MENWIRENKINKKSFVTMPATYRSEQISHTKAELSQLRKTLEKGTKVNEGHSLFYLSFFFSFLDVFNHFEKAKEL